MAHDAIDKPDEIMLPETARQAWQQYITAARATCEVKGVNFSNYEIAGDRLRRVDSQDDEQ